MQNVLQIIEWFGGWEKLADHSIHLRVDGFMPLSIEHLEPGPRGGALISIMHHFVQNGDLMRDPDLVLEYFADSKQLLPLSYQQDSLGVFQEVLRLDEQGQVIGKNLALQKDIQAFMALWDRNLADQGFLTAAQAKAASSAQATDDCE